MNTLLAIEQADLRLAIELLLNEEPGVKVVGEASESEGLLALIKTTDPDIVIFDTDLPGRPVAGLLTEVHEREARPLLIVLDKNPRNKEKLLDAGADAFVVKGDPPDKLLAAFRRVSLRAKSSKHQREAK